MNKFFRILCLLSVVVLSSCSSNEVKINLEIPFFKMKEVQLIYGDQIMKGTFDSLGVVSFTFDMQDVNYCSFSLGGKPINCYIEPGEELKVTYRLNRDKETGSSFDFEGNLKEENMLLHNVNFYLPLKMTREAANDIDVMWNLLTSLTESNLSRLDSLAKQKKYSSRFLTLERERVRYANMGLYGRCQKWSPKIYSYLESLITVHEELFGLSEYMDFMKNGVYVMGYKNLSQINPLSHATSQVNYIVHNMAAGKVKEYLLQEVIAKYIENNGIDEADNLIALAGSNLLEKESHLKQVYNDWSGLKKGASVPKFTFVDKEGKVVSLDQFKGKYVFIDCWASWCSPCRAEIPHLKKLEEKFKERNIVFVGISSDNNKGKWLEALASLDLHGIQLLDNDTMLTFSNFFKVTSIPRFILLNPEGRIERCVMTRPSDPETLDILNDLI